VAWLAAAGVVVALAAVGVVQGGASSAEPTVQAFLLAWQNGQYRNAAALTTGRQKPVVAALAGAYRQLDATGLALSMGAITQRGSTAQATFDASIDLGGSGLRWTYQGSFPLRRSGSGWQVVWSPSVIVPGLQSGQRLAVVSSMPSRAQILDASGQPLAVSSPVYVIGVQPGKLSHPHRTAADLANATGLDADQVYGQIVAAPTAHFLELVTLQPAAYRKLRSALANVPGLIVRYQRERLFNSIAPALVGSVGTETSQALQARGEPYRPGATIGLSGLQAAFQDRLTGSATTEVVVQNAAGREVSVLHRWRGSTAAAVRTTVSEKVQQAADEAVAGLPDSAAIVALQPGTGRILGVGQHQASGMPAVSPLAGRYEPGQAFTIISTAALLDGGFNINSRVPCKAVNSVGGRTFANTPAKSGLGAQPPFESDFANACTTAFVGLSMQLNAADLAVAAARFGIGAGWQLPLSRYTGGIGSPAGYGQIAADTIGGGAVRVSPLDMALAAALVQSGSWHAPSLVTTPADPGLTLRGKFSQQVVDSLRTLMRATVTKGAGTAANVGGGSVYGQVGNAPLGQHGLRTSWFVGYQGDIAFAVIELTKSTSQSAAPLAGSFLRALHHQG
jgi:cell division protein FtsI/penicillin-binding protein 2